MIDVREITIEEINEFWDMHIGYLVEDEIISSEEDVEYFSGEEYRGVLEKHMKRHPDRQHMVYFLKGKDKVGAASYCTFQSEDGKCFILDFWVFAGFRGCGLGHECFHALEKHTKTEGACYYEINSTKEASIRFWKSLGFSENGTDQWGMPLFIRRG